MKTKIVRKTFALWFALCLLTTPYTLLAQSVEKTDGVDQKKTTIRETENADDKSRPDIPEPKAGYEFIEPQNIYNFMLALKEAGKRGFRLRALAPLPGRAAETSKKAAKGMMLSGVVAFDGENRYDYNFFFAEGEKDPEQTLNDLSRDGWRFRDVISVFGEGDDDSLPIEDIFANRLRKFPTLGNIYVLERTLEGNKSPAVYKLLKAGVGTGRSPTAKIQALLDQSAGEGYVPVGPYYSFDVKSLFSVDSFCGIIMEKAGQAGNLEYKFVRGNRSDGLWKDIDEFSKQGFRIGLLNFSNAILIREKGGAAATAPVTYLRLVTDHKNYATDLAAALAKNPSFYSAGAYATGMEVVKNLLIFQENGAASDGEIFEYRFGNMLPVVPKQYKKNPQEYLKNLDKPEVVFQKSLDDGYIPRDLYFSEKEGLMILFARRKKQ
jgi:hypothetical protein